ncbi:MAG TPA: hypothetical protein VFU69_12265 [Ktedonobacterales bacterium]|nr:hypothetical protein [Ktedonobacterales bacterium]
MSRAKGGAAIPPRLKSTGLPGRARFCDEQNVYNSSNAVIGRENTFSGTNCGTSNTSGSAILWSSGTGAHEVQGCIYHAYVNFGGAASALGLPISDEYTNSAGQRESDFQGGNIIWWNNQAFINLNGVCC